MVSSQVVTEHSSRNCYGDPGCACEQTLIFLHKIGDVRRYNFFHSLMSMLLAEGRQCGHKEGNPRRLESQKPHKDRCSMITVQVDHPKAVRP